MPSPMPETVLTPLPDPDPGGTVVLHPDSFTKWSAMFAAHPHATDYLLAAGDYRPWGTYVFSDQAGDRAGRPAVIRYFDDPSPHPVRRLESQALIAGFQFRGPATRSWILHGLTFREPSIHLTIAHGASDITIDYCLVEDYEGYGVRVRSSAVCVQRCVVRNSVQTWNPADSSMRDTVGIQAGNAGQNAVVTGVRLLRNEIYNVGDGIQIGMNATEPVDAALSPVEVTIDGNDIYLEPTRYLDGDLTWDENALDIKAGSDSTQTVVTNNRMWGYRRNKGRTAAGELLVINDCARNVLIQDNIFGDAPRGMKDENWDRRFGLSVDLPRYIVVRHNQWHDIVDRASSDRGAVTKPVTADVVFNDNVVARCDFLADEAPQGGYRGAGPHYRHNTFVDVAEIQRPPAAPLPPARLRLTPDDGNLVVTAPAGYALYQRRQWTGPELAASASPIV